MSRQNQPKQRTYPHFALIYLDHRGNLHHKTSQSIQNSCDTILSSAVTNAFLEAVSCSGEALPSSFQLENGATTPSTLQRPLGSPDTLRPLLCRASQNSETLDGHVGSGPTTRRPCPQQHPQTTQQDSIIRSKEKALISVQDKIFLYRYYEKAFQNMQQSNCRLLAKAYVKFVEPRKQINYPYNGRKSVAGIFHQFKPDEIKPPWWPSGVSHREPDHLSRAELIRLLIHILCALHFSHGVTARRLQEADQPIRLQISPPDQLQILDEVYYVREAEENLQDGLIDGKALVLVARANLPAALKATQNLDSQDRRSSPTENISSHECGPVQRTITTQSAFTSGPILSGLSPTTLYPPSPRYTGYIPQDLERKFQYMNFPPSATTGPSLYYQSMFVGPQSVISSAYSELHDFTTQKIPTTAPQGAEQYEARMGTYAFPHYFDDTGLSYWGFPHGRDNNMFT